MSSSEQSGFVKAEGGTDAERYLQRLCNRSFLSLWSHMGIFRDQKACGTTGDGKELCDLLVVFGSDILIFSDRACEFKNTGNLELDWSRWFRKAVLKSADQVWGAERWIKQYPKRMFLDRACTKPFPIDMPDPQVARFHRIVVAHQVHERCRQELGGSGSLIINTSVVGSAHFGKPFTVGQLDPARGFVHVLDDVTLDTLLQTLDTARDLIEYLAKKEAAIQRRLFWAAGEEDLLAFYLGEVNEDKHHDFVLPPECAAVVIQEGGWARFIQHPQRLAQVAADEISYTWDDLIETFTGHILAGTQYYTTHRGIGDNERGLRCMAQEPRLRRRMLAESLYELIGKTPSEGVRATRLVPPTGPGEPCYVFLLLPYQDSISDADYRLMRRRMLEACCFISKLLSPEVQDIVGIATEPWGMVARSEDFLYFDARQWSEHDQQETVQLQELTGLLRSMTITRGTVHEYPTIEDGPTQQQY